MRGRLRLPEVRTGFVPLNTTFGLLAGHFILSPQAFQIKDEQPHSVHES
jgi:hypothetical protein